MPTFEEDFAAFTAPGPSQSLPGAVLLAATTSSDIVYSHSVGLSSLESTVAKPLTPKTIFWIASCTKLLTSLAALQLIESGKIEVDTPVGDILPELASPDILEGWNSDGTPNLRKATRKIELRHLLTHTSGLGYGFLSEDIMKWYTYKKMSPEEMEGDILREYNVPLLFEPGTSWNYSPGLDWAGLLIARVSGEADLQAYMRKHIWGPLGIDSKDMAFRPKDLGLSEAETAERVVRFALRKQGDQSMVPVEYPRDFNSKDCLGGGGIHATPEAYLAVLRSLLRNDGKILSPATLEKYMLEPQLTADKIGTSAYDGLIHTCNTLIGSKMLTGGLPIPNEEGAHEYQHGLLGLLNRPKGTKDWTLTWGGLPNLFWHVFPAQGICGIYASQIIPPGDPKSMEMAVRFRQEMIKRFGKSKEKSNL